MPRFLMRVRCMVPAVLGLVLVAALPGQGMLQSNPGQPGTSATVAASPVPESEAAESPGTSQRLSRGFDDLVLGLGFDELDRRLKAHAGFVYRGLPELSLSPGQEERIIETKGGRFVSRAVFQFRDDVLFSIILDFNPRELDYFTLYTDFVRRYGEPKDLNPQKAWWEDQEVRIILEKPLNIRYQWKATITELLERSGAQATLREESRSDFIQKL